MAETSYPVAGGGSVTDAAYEKLMQEITASGFVGNAATQTPVMYADSTGRQIKLAANRAALIHGFRWETDSAGLTYPVAANTSGQPRLDLGVLRLTRSDPTPWQVRFALKTGTPAATPVAPGLTQSLSATSVWEIPCGTVLVRSTSSTDAGNGLPSIAAADVTALDYYRAPQSIVCHSTRMPAVPPGGIVSQYDTGRVYTRIGSTYHLIGEDGPWTNVPGAAGWDNSNIWCVRRNGFVYFQAFIYRNTPGVSSSAGTDLAIATLPAQFRPAFGDAYLVGTHNDWPARFHIARGTGLLQIVGYPDAGMADNHFIVVHPTVWPAP